MKYDGTNVSHKKFKAKFRTRVNLVWGKVIPTSKREALAYPQGFPATLYLTDRRIFVTGTFIEKKGLLQKKSMNTVYFEAGLQYVDKYKLDIYKKVKSGYISFNSHGDVHEGVIHFLRLTREMIRTLQEAIENVKDIKKLRENTGIVILGQDPIEILKERLRK
ncbi:MAG: hypothetical protein JW776_09950 [Candidatus Lokiarchaeota archaeon]|nr:hypothetical protein [Candidatus Lokiarchaeota archaeon]